MQEGAIINPLQHLGKIATQRDIEGALKNYLEKTVTQQDIKYALKKQYLEEDIKQNQHVITALAKKIKARGGGPAEALHIMENYKPNLIMRLFLWLYEFCQLESERTILNKFREIHRKISMKHKYLIKNANHFKVIQEPNKINGSFNKTGKCKKVGQKEGTTKYDNEHCFKHYENKSNISSKDKMRLEVVSNEMLKVALGKEKVTKYRITIIGGKEQVVSKACGKKTLGEYLKLDTNQNFWDPESYYDKFKAQVMKDDENSPLLKEFIKLNLTCIYLLRNFDFHPFNIILNVENNTIKSFIPIDFGACLQDKNKTRVGILSFKKFISDLSKPDLVKECMEEVQQDLQSKKDEIIKHRDECAADLQVSPDECQKIKKIWCDYTEKLAGDCQKGQISLGAKTYKL